MKIIYSFLLFFTIIGDLKSQNIVKIGKQNWMQENLSVSTFRNGESIPEAKSTEEWIRANDEKKPVWCTYEYSDSNGKYYGKLYNIYALQDSRGLAPKGFHVPSENEWNELIEVSGGIANAGRILKHSEGWCNSGNGANNSVFKGKPGGFLDESGDFINIKCGAYWWTKESRVIFLNWSNSAVEKNDGLASGFYVRCVKD